MLFRKKMKLTDFLEGPFLELVLTESSFRHENFYEEYQNELSPTPLGQPPTGEKELFTSRFLGAFIWLLKYRTLSTNKNSPRKLAFLDMLFDIEVPRLIDKHMKVYDTAIIKETYDTMDIRCKREYTSEVTNGGPPSFQVSPIWAKNVKPSPYYAAAKIFTWFIAPGTPPVNDEPVLNEKFTENLAHRFERMTDPVEETAVKINFSWSAPREKRDPSPSDQEPGST